MNKKFAKTLAMVLVIAMLLSLGSFAFADADTTSADDGNDYPIVLVHGLFGWGGTEIANLNYWGGFSSLQQMLTDAGYEVYTPSIGPVASNWDRACELYAYLVGGTVDYGQYHSAQNGHSRYGRTFKGVLPELNNADSTLKIHLVGHSMGGETIRMLAQLLENGDADELRATTDGSISKLFTGTCRHWIESITTLCTPHDGSQYDGKVYNEEEPLVHRFVAALSAATGMNINEENLGLDFKLDQWGLTREPGESYESYIHRVENSNLWKDDVKDLSVYDLSPDGAAVLNSYAKAQDDIYYFSVACSDTYRSAVYPHHYLPYSNINPLMKKSATYMGSYKNYAAGTSPSTRAGGKTTASSACARRSIRMKVRTTAATSITAPKTALWPSRTAPRRAFGTTSRRSNGPITSTWSARSQTRSISRANSSRWPQCSQASLPTAARPMLPQAFPLSIS